VEADDQKPIIRWRFTVRLLHGTLQIIAGNHQFFDICYELCCASFVGLISMCIFRILPLSRDVDLGWVVETTHGSGIVETSIVYPTQAKAQAAADSWVHLDEDWAKV
jgi:hypothetical protein